MEEGEGEEGGGGSNRKEIVKFKYNIYIDIGVAKSDRS